ncbi:hypothetical protein FI667_g7789, partial [Globisporangium splendens]
MCAFAASLGRMERELHVLDPSVHHRDVWRTQQLVALEGVAARAPAAHLSRGVHLGGDCGCDDRALPHARELMSSSDPITTLFGSTPMLALWGLKFRAVQFFNRIGAEEFLIPKGCRAAGCRRRLDVPVQAASDNINIVLKLCIPSLVQVLSTKNGGDVSDTRRTKQRAPPHDAAARERGAAGSAERHRVRRVRARHVLRGGARGQEHERPHPALLARATAAGVVLPRAQDLARTANPTAKVPPGLSIKYEVTFQVHTTAVDAIFHDALQIKGDDHSCVEVPLLACKACPILDVEPSLCDHGLVVLTQRATQYVRLRNTGTRPGRFRIEVLDANGGSHGGDNGGNGGGNAIVVTPMRGCLAPKEARNLKIEVVGKDVGVFRGIVRIRIREQPPGAAVVEEEDEDGALASSPRDEGGGLATEKIIDVCGKVVAHNVELVLKKNGFAPVKNLYFGSLFAGECKVIETVLRNNGPQPLFFKITLTFGGSGGNGGCNSNAGSSSASLSAEDEREAYERRKELQVYPAEGRVEPFADLVVAFTHHPRGVDLLKLKQLEARYRQAELTQDDSNNQNSTADGSSMALPPMVLNAFTSIQCADLQNQNLTFEVAGKAIYPKIDISPSSTVDFGDVKSARGRADQHKRFRGTIPMDVDESQCTSLEKSALLGSAASAGTMPATKCVFEVLPPNGSLQPASTHACQVVYTPPSAGTALHQYSMTPDKLGRGTWIGSSFQLEITGGKRVTLACKALVQELKVTAKEKKVDFGTISVGMEKEKKITLLNATMTDPTSISSSSSWATFYATIEPASTANSLGITVSPSVGTILAQESSDLVVKIVPHKSVVLDSNVTLHVQIRGGRSVRIPILASVLVPEVYISPQSVIGFGEVVLGVSVPRIVSLENRSAIPACLLLDLGSSLTDEFAVVMPPKPLARLEDISSVFIPIMDKESSHNAERPTSPAAISTTLTDSTEGDIAGMSSSSAIARPESITRKVTATAIAPRLLFSSAVLDFHRCVITREGIRKVPYTKFIVLTNNDSKSVKWQIDTSQLKHNQMANSVAAKRAGHTVCTSASSVIFHLAPEKGELAPAEEVKIRVSFLPLDAVEYVEEVIPLLLDDQFYIHVSVKSKGIHPHLSFPIYLLSKKQSEAKLNKEKQQQLNGFIDLVGVDGKGLSEGESSAPAHAAIH